jgi:hypothetical protein
MAKRLILSVGMPRAGSGWHYNLTHDLVVAAGGRDARQIRRRYRLQAILSEVNCNIGTLTSRRVLLCMLPVLFGNTYTIKAHAGPKILALTLIRVGLIQATYIYRDPRDAALSAYEYGYRARQRGGANAFTHLETIEQAIALMQTYVRISQTWLACPQVHSLRYENLLADYDNEVNQLVAFFGINPTEPQVKTVLDRYRPELANIDQPGLHFAKGKTGRFRQVLTPQQQELCLQSFGSYLEKVGYPL